ncbi:MAG: hypothetical protein ACJ74Z_14840 [Bryobacteraceae bacterium]
MLGHTHSAYTHFSGKALAGYRIDVSKIIRDRRFLGADLITGQLVDQSGQGRTSIPFKLSTYDCHFTDPVHLDHMLAAMQTELDSHASQITLVYPDV